MAGIFGSSAEDKARWRELNRYLDKHAASDREQQQYLDALDDTARKVLKDKDWLFTIYDEYPHEFMSALALMFYSADKYEKGVPLEMQRNLAFIKCRDTLIEKAAMLPGVRKLAYEMLEEDD